MFCSKYTMLGTSKSISGFDPRSIPGCRLWLDGADPLAGALPANGATVSTWYDKSGNGYNAPATVSGATFTAASQNGNGYITFPTGKYFTTSNFILSSTNTPTIFLVCQQTGYGSGNSDIISASTGTPYSYYTLDIYGNSGTKNLAVNMWSNVNVNGNISIANPTVISIVGSGSPTYSVTMWGNGTSNVTFTGYASNPLSTSNSFWIGAISAGFIGNIYEVLFYDTAFTTTQRQSVEGYLAWKWGLQVQVPAPVSTPRSISGCVLWLDGADNSTMNSTTTVTSWTDKSGSGNTMTGTGTFSGSNMTFNGSTQAFSNTTFVFPSSAYSMFAVYSNTTAPASGAYMNVVYGNGGYPMMGTFNTTKSVTARSVAANTGGLGQTSTVTGGWATRIASTGDEVITAIATDSNGNVLVTGYHAVATTLYNAPGTVSGATLSNSGQADILVAKYSSAGAVTWVARIGGTGNDAGKEITTDSSGNVIVTGQYNAAVTAYNSDTTSGPTLANSGGYDACIVKYSSTGTVTWATRIAGTTDDAALGVATDSSGNVFVTGVYSGTATLYNSDTTTGATLTNAGLYDVFIAKYSSAGTLTWATRIGSTGYDYGFGIATDSTGNVFVTGQYASAVTLYNTGGGTGATLTNSGVNDVFLAKYSSAGAVLWATRIASTGDDSGNGVATDSAGNVVVTGSYNGALTLYNTGGGTGATLTNSGGSDAFLAKYSSAGAVIWATRIASTGGDGGGGVATDSAGNVFVIGGYSAALTLYNTGGGTGATLTISGSYDAFLAKYSSEGTLTWATRSANVAQYKVATDSAGNVVVCGYYPGTPTMYNSDTTTGATLTFVGVQDGYIAKYSSTGFITANTVYSGGYPASSTILVDGTYTPSTFSPFVNGSSVTALTGTVAAATGIYVGGPSNYFNGSVSEILVFNSVLSTTQRQSVENYLMGKWGIKPSLPATHPFYSLPAFSRPFGPTDIPGCALWLDAADLNSIAFTTPPLAYFPFDGSIVDQSNVITFTTTGSVPYVTGKYGQAVSFVNAQGAVSSNYLSSTYNLPSTFTIACWVQLPVTSGKYTFITTGPNSGYSLGNINFYVSAGNMYCSYNHIANNGAGYAVSANTWYHAAITYNSGTLLLYVNGAQSGSPVTAAGSTINGITIGGGADLGPDPYPVTGYVDDLRIFTSVLTAAQISNIYTNTQTSNVVLWKDKSGNGNNGTSIGNAGSTVWSSNGMGGYPAIAFDGATGSFSGTIASNTGSTLSMFAVAFMNLGTSVNVYPRIISLAASGSQDWNLPTSTFLGRNGAFSSPQSVMTWRNNATLSYQPITYGVPFVASSVYTGSSNTTYANGTTAGAGASSGNFNVNAYNIGRIAGGAGFNTDSTLLGSVSEVLVYNTALTTTQRQQIEGYLAAKWGLLNNLPGKTLSPLNIPGCALWLDASDATTISYSGSAVISIKEKAQGITLTAQGTSSFLTTPAASIGSLQSLLFNNPTNANVYLSGTFQSILTGCVFIVWKSLTQSAANFYPIFTWNSGSTYPAYGQLGGAALGTYGPYTAYGGSGTPTFVATANTNYLTFYSWSGTTPTVGINGAAPTSGTQPAFSGSTTTFWIGADSTGGAQRTNMNLGELIIFNSVISSNQRQSVENYLMSKWGISNVTSHPFKSIPPSTSQPPQFQEVTPGNWKYDWQPYLQRLAAANNPTNATVIPTLSYGAAAPGGNGGVLGPNNCVYAVSSTNLMIYNIATNTTSSVTLSTAAGQRGGVLAPNGYLYFGGDSNILIVNPSNNSYSYINFTYTGGQTTAGGVLAPNGNIYYSTYYAARSMVVNTSNNTVSSITLPGGQGWIGACLAPNGLIYAVPYGATTSVLVINPNTNTYSNITPSLTPALSTQNYTGCVLGPNGLIYGIPYSASNILIINPATNSVTYGTGGPSLSPALSTQTMYCGVLAPNGNIYGMPIGGASNILIINTFTNAVSWGTGGSSLSPALSTQGYASAVLAPNGNIYGIPGGASNMLIISNTYAQLPSSNCCLSAFLNKY